MIAIFGSTQQALHVSFLILSVPAMGDNKFRQFLIQAMEETANLSEVQGKWLDQLRGAPSSTVNFGGLSQLEVRGQCAMIVAAVKHRLPSMECGAILAHYGIGADKGEGIQRLALHARRSCGIGSLAPCLKLTARNFLSEDEHEGLSFRALADEYKLTKDTVFRAAVWMKKNYRTIEQMAIERLDRKFKAQGVVEIEEYVDDEPASPPVTVAIPAEPELACF
jgi:hypothetical protein